MNKNAVNKACPQLGINNVLLYSQSKSLLYLSWRSLTTYFFTASLNAKWSDSWCLILFMARALPFVFKRIYFPAYILVKVFHYSKNNNIFLKRDQQWKSKFSECLKELQMKLQIGNESRVWLKMAICWCIEQIYILYRYGQRPPRHLKVRPEVPIKEVVFQTQWSY